MKKSADKAPRKPICDRISFPVTKTVLRRAIHNSWNHIMRRRDPVAHFALFASQLFEQALRDLEPAYTAGEFAREHLSVADLRPHAELIREDSFSYSTFKNIPRELVKVLEKFEHEEEVEESSITFRFLLSQQASPGGHNALYAISVCYGTFPRQRKNRSRGACPIAKLPLRTTRGPVKAGTLPDPSTVLVQMRAAELLETEITAEQTREHFAATREISVQTFTTFCAPRDYTVPGDEAVTLSQDIPTVRPRGDRWLAQQTFTCECRRTSLNQLRRFMVTQSSPLVSQIIITWLRGSVPSDIGVALRRGAAQSRFPRDELERPDQRFNVFVAEDVQLWLLVPSEEVPLKVFIGGKPESLRKWFWRDDLKILLEEWLRAGAS